MEHRRISSLPWCRASLLIQNTTSVHPERKDKRQVAAAKSLQSCPTLCDPIDSSPPGSPIPGILQARTLEWVAISSSDAWKWKVKVKWLSHVWLLATPLTAAHLLATPLTAAHQAPPSMEFSRQEYWSGLPLPSPKDKLGLLKIQNFYSLKPSINIVKS